MIIILKPDVAPDGPQMERLRAVAGRYPGLQLSTHVVQGSLRALTEVYVFGETGPVPTDSFSELPFVERVFRVSQKYRRVGRHQGQAETVGFTYNGVELTQDTLHVFAGLCAVDTRGHVEMMFAALQAEGQVTARMGAYKPRTSPYDFQGHGADCLPYVFELAGRYGIKVIAMEVTHEAHVSEIAEALRAAGDPTGVMLQIGTRNAQNFELLKEVGRQTDFPVLFKRGMGITLEESINACEYIASEGNSRIVFCLRGIKSNLGDPHRNLVDFAHVPVVKRLTRLPVCVDPSHSVGSRAIGPDGLMDNWHVTAQGVIAGANMVLVDFHPAYEKALCDGPQALRLEEIGPFFEDVRIAREAYERRRANAARLATA